MWVRLRQKEISSWLPMPSGRQEQGNGVSITLPIEGIGFYFKATTLHLSVFFNGKKLIKKHLTLYGTDHHSRLFILFLTSDYFVYQFCQDYCFKLVISHFSRMKVQSSGVHWVCKQDI
ncbi:hypothetical protein PIB30_019066 [Stylosanthes scabra]|uniref:Galectin n=1 Tax=Stylosanthes scabra TaxID=79078 RepID=A0ABU6T7Z3_9FABA|nr:hypothetical protein [Stylosanthes scabra]